MRSREATRPPGSRVRAVNRRGWGGRDGQCVRLGAGGWGSPTLGSAKGLLEPSSLETVRNGPGRGGRGWQPAGTAHAKARRRTWWGQLQKRLVFGVAGTGSKVTVAGPRLVKQPGKEGGANSRVARLPRGLGAAWGCDGVGYEAAAQELDAGSAAGGDEGGAGQREQGQAGVTSTGPSSGALGQRAEPDAGGCCSRPHSVLRLRHRAWLGGAE